MQRISSVVRITSMLAVGTVSMSFAGCTSIGWLGDPTKTGRIADTATTVPILDRIDVIEPAGDGWGAVTQVQSSDLEPSELEYRMVPGDIVTVSIYELFREGEWFTAARAINADGSYRIPELGDMDAAGLSAEEFEQRVTARASEIINNPQVDVIIEQGAAFRYTVYGSVPSPGLYTLQSSDLRLLEALAQAGGAPLTTNNVYVVRTIPLEERYIGETESPMQPLPDRPQPPTSDRSIDDIIRDIEGGGDTRDNNNNRNNPGGAVSPGMLSQDGDQPVIDIDDLRPDEPAQTPEVDIDQVRPPSGDGARSPYTYDPERQIWVRRDDPSRAAADAPQRPIIERVIKVDYKQLARGDGSLNVVIRPGDRIYVEPPLLGLVYVDGEVVRPGVYQLDALANGTTLSGLVSAAGGLNQTAIPTRVDLIRRVGRDRKAFVRLNLAAIRRGTEPDVFIKPDDEIIIGTSWYALPAAVIRNGFRMTYGFGFLLDRNFGNDVFGAPPDSRQF